MKAAERGFLLLSSHLGNPDRRPLTTAQMRTLADRSWKLDHRDADREMKLEDLTALGYGREMASRILELLSQEELLEEYLRIARCQGCCPITRVSEEYPLIVRKRLGLDSPGVLWAKGDTEILKKPKIGLVGSRDIHPDNFRFAQEVGTQAALQGYVLVSGNARGSDRAAQDACLAAGGQVIIVVADSLAQHSPKQNVLYLSEDGFDLDFSAQRALSRNRVIHCLGSLVTVAQCSLGTGGTWDGTVRNLRYGWSPVCCYGDGSQAMKELEQLGAQSIDLDSLGCFEQIYKTQISFFDQ